MKRRQFIRTGAAAMVGAGAGAVFATSGTYAGVRAALTGRSRDGTATAIANGANGSATTAPGAQRPFKLDYAPHFGMFRNSAGEDLLDQLRFMAAEGFRSLEDNGMRGRSVEEQEAIAGEMVCSRKSPSASSTNQGFRLRFATPATVPVPVRSTSE